MPCGGVSKLAVAARSSSPRLTKSGYISGRQCPLKLWFDVKRPADREPDKNSIDDGVEEFAWQLFPGGKQALQPGLTAAENATRTAALMADADCPAIFEATILAGRLLARIDVLERCGDGWNLIEVKSATTFDPTKDTISAKRHIKYDVAFQYHVLSKAQIQINAAFVYHLNPEYELHGELDPSMLFRRVEVTAVCAELAASVAVDCRDQLAILDAPAPVAEPGSRCRTPYDCDHFDTRCRPLQPRHWTYTHLYRANRSHIDKLRERGIRSVLDITDESTAAFSSRLRDSYRSFRDVYVSGQPRISPLLESEMEELGPPAAYLDFETVAPPVPRYQGTGPHSQIPFQYSLHIWHGGEELEHFEYLADPHGDPRPGMAVSLVNHLGEHPELPVIAYFASFEAGCLDRLIATEQDRARQQVLARIKSQLKDLLPVVRDNLVSAGFAGSYSIKSVAPAILGPDQGYDNLAVANGLQAQEAFEQMVAGRIKGPRLQQTRADLLHYCKLDTYYLHRIARQLGDRPGLIAQLTSDPGTDSVSTAESAIPSPNSRSALPPAQQDC